VILLHFGKELVEEVLNVIPKDYCVSKLDLEAQVMPVIKYAGDFLAKRTFLSRASTLLAIDPLGMVSPFTVRARIMFYVMWTAGLAWDENLPAEHAKTAST